jgi:hypothetical protein
MVTLHKGRYIAIAILGAAAMAAGTEIPMPAPHKTPRCLETCAHRPLPIPL